MYIQYLHTYSGQDRCWDDRGSYHSPWGVKEGIAHDLRLVRWVRLARNVGDTLARTHALRVYTHTRICALTRTMKLPCRQSDNNSLASIHFLWEQSLLSSLFLSESLTVRARTHKREGTHSRSRRILLTLSTSASLFLFFFHLPCYWWIPDMTEPPSRLGPPMAACQPADNRDRGTIAFIKRQRRFTLHPYRTSSLSLSLSLSSHLPPHSIFPPRCLSPVITH